MGEIDPAKRRAAEAAAALVENGMAIGIGSGTTAALMVEVLGLRVAQDKLRIVAVATSEETAMLARSVGIPLADLDEFDALDLNLDGADEIDTQFRMIKGRGGALLREKIVVSTSRRRVTIVTAEKRVEQLGVRIPVPVEVSRFGLLHTQRRLHDMGGSVALRVGPDGLPFVTDGGNAILDCHFAAIADPRALDREIRLVVGVFETGLFVDLCDELIVGHPDRVERVERPKRPSEL